MEDVKSISYKKFAELLERYQVTPYQVSQSSKVSQSTLSDWKTGRSRPKIENLQKIARYFKVSIEYFLEGD